MNSSVFIFILILSSILISNRLSPKVYIQPIQRLLFLGLILLGCTTALFPYYIAGPLTKLLDINRTSDLIVYFLIIFIIATLNGLYREIRELNSRMIKLMQKQTIEKYIIEYKSEQRKKVKSL